MTFRLKDALKRLVGHYHLKEATWLLWNSTAIMANDFKMKLLANPRYADPKKLSHFEHQVFSQNGEDGIIAEIFRRIRLTNRVFCEIGAGDGLENNTCFLLFQGWTGSWIEGGLAEFGEIQRTFYEPISTGQLRVKQAIVTVENINEIVREMLIPDEFDLLSIDIDRNTSHVWRAIERIKPRVVVVEYNSTFPPEIDWEVPYVAGRAWNGSHYFGASLLATEQIGRIRGYVLVGCDLSGTNAFFVREDLAEGKFPGGPSNAVEHYEPPRHFLSRRQAHRRAFSDSREK
jgi:hypothetical protein